MTEQSVPPAHRGLAGRPIYLDYNSTTPVDPRVAATAAPLLEICFGNPSSDHAFGDAARRAVGDAREQVAALVAAAADEIVFCGSGSEADELAIRGALLGSAGPGQRMHVVTQATEHPAVLATTAAMRRWHGVEVTILPVDQDGLVCASDLETALATAAADGARIVVSIMAANAETGTVQPVAELAELAHRHGAIFHCDAAQAVGKIDIDVGALGVDVLTTVGHKMYAPKGIAALYVRRGLPIEPLVYGGGQEQGRRSGTEAVASIVAFGTASTLAAEALAAGESGRLGSCRDRLHELLADALPGRVILNGSPDRRLPNTLNVSIDGISGRDLLAATPGVAASVGSACHSGSHEPSPVLTAMGLAAPRALGAVRLSLGRWTTTDEVERAGQLLAASARDRHG